MLPRRIPLAVIMTLCWWRAAPARADFIVIEATRFYFLEVDNGEQSDETLVNIAGLGLLQDTVELAVPGMASSGLHDTWLTTTSFGGHLEAMASTTRSDHFVWAQVGVVVTFDLETATAISTFLNITSQGGGSELTAGSFFLTDLETGQYVIGSDGDVEPVTIVLEPGSYELVVGFWRIHSGLTGSTTKLGDFEFTIVPAPGGIAAFGVALLVRPRRRRD
jgi:hypothetical protein